MTQLYKNILLHQDLTPQACIKTNKSFIPKSHPTQLTIDGDKRSIHTPTIQFSNSLKKARINKQLTQAKLAILSGVTERIIKDYENPSSNINVNSALLSKLNKVLNINIKLPHKTSLINPSIDNN